VSAILKVLLKSSKELKDETLLDHLMAIDGGGKGAGEELEDVLAL
jgi:hypothetical protein